MKFRLVWALAALLSALWMLISDQRQSLLPYEYLAAMPGSSSIQHLNATAANTSNFAADLDNNTSNAGSHQTTTMLPTNRTISLIIHLRGEMGNNLALLVHAYAVKLSLERKYQRSSLRVELIGQHQYVPKWKSAAYNLQTCFPVLRDFNFNGGRWDEEFKSIRDQQDAWLGDKTSRLHVDQSCARRGLCWEPVGEYLEALIAEQVQDPTGTEIQEPLHSSYSLPHLHSNTMSIFDVLVDEWYDEIREWLQLDQAACCAQQQAPADSDNNNNNNNTTVLHIRNFAAESPQLLKKGYQELDADGVATRLLSDLPVGSKVSIVSRYTDNLQPYINALSIRGLNSHVVTGQSDMQDFCTLYQTRGLLVGSKMSTYVALAALLGDAAMTRLYVVNSTYTRNRDSGLFKHYRSRRPEIRDRFEFPVYHVS